MSSSSHGRVCFFDGTSFLSVLKGHQRETHDFEGPPKKGTPGWMGMSRFSIAEKGNTAHDFPRCPETIASGHLALLRSASV